MGAAARAKREKLGTLYDGKHGQKLPWKTAANRKHVRDKLTRLNEQFTKVGMTTASTLCAAEKQRKELRERLAAMEKPKVVEKKAKEPVQRSAPATPVESKAVPEQAPEFLNESEKRRAEHRRQDRKHKGARR